VATDGRVLAQKLHSGIRTRTAAHFCEAFRGTGHGHRITGYGQRYAVTFLDKCDELTLGAFGDQPAAVDDADPVTQHSGGAVTAFLPVEDQLKGNILPHLDDLGLVAAANRDHDSLHAVGHLGGADAPWAEKVPAQSGEEGTSPLDTRPGVVRPRGHHHG
jgi:hypothetical protein